MNGEKSITSAEMRALEQAAMGTGAVTGLQLMERAGQGVAEAILETWPEFARAPARGLVLCGPGNNGGDGFVVARLLKQRGWEIDLFMLGDPERLPPDARENCEAWRAMGDVKSIHDAQFDGWPEPEGDVDLVIDALFGIGLSRPFLSLGLLQDQLNYIQAHYGGRSDLPGGVVAIDVPSGMDADSGTYPGYKENPFDMCIVANLTVTFHAPKPAHLDPDGAKYCGLVVVKDIGL